MECSSESFFSEVLNHYKERKPFVIYRKSDASKISGLLQMNDIVFYSKEYKESGFIFSPFDSRKEGVLIPFDNSKKLECSAEISSDKVQSVSISEDDLAQNKHINLVEKGIKKIKTSSLEKVVLSRTKEVAVEDLDFITIYKKLTDKYPQAFCYVWFHPKIGFWMGATPETLLTIYNESFKTMALAGTQKFEGTTDVIWGEKEIIEQELVTKSILVSLNEIASTVSVSDVKTVKAGSLLHLRTDIKGEIANTSSVAKFIESLHPTPAVCGLPKIMAKDFILENENYDREFYTGFLGELNKEVEEDIRTELYVNLRCMQYKEDSLLLYVGGGITNASNAELEWQETENKTQTMLDVLLK